MNGYQLMADSYKKLLAEDKMTKEEAEPEIRIFEFLATCSHDDLCRMVDSSAFNDIIKAYLEMLIKNAGLDEKDENKVMNQLRYVFDEKSAAEVLQNYLH